MTILLIVIGLLILGVAARRWGINSSDGFNSREWDRRRHWRGFGGDGMLNSTL